jgi:hypothetical protein
LRGYLECGVLAFGFTRVVCDSCKDELLVAFSCKRRGVCPSCTARRATDTAARLVEEVLPQAPYRQWTFSLPKRVRWILARHSDLVTEVLGVLVRALFGYQRKRAMGLGFGECESGAVTFIQRFNSALLLNIHYHALASAIVREQQRNTTVSQFHLRLSCRTRASPEWTRHG